MDRTEQLNMPGRGETCRSITTTCTLHPLHACVIVFAIDRKTAEAQIQRLDPAGVWLERKEREVTWLSAIEGRWVR